MNSFNTDYLTLVLEIEKHIDGYIDSYLGSAELKERIVSAEKQPPAALLNSLHQLRSQIPLGDSDRIPFLTAQLRAIETTLRMLNGEEIDYAKEVALIYDIEPQSRDEADFLAAHKQLEELLPGDKLIADRMAAWRNQFRIPNDQVLALLEPARDECRRRTEKLIALVPDESIDIQLTQNQPWGAYNWFLGNGHSLIEFNIDTPISATRVLSTFAHEAYPGHHTEHQLKEQHLWKGKGYAEFAAMLLHSPSAVLAEGIATTAAKIIFPKAEYNQWIAENLLPALDLDPALADEMAIITQATGVLRYVGGNAALLYHTGKLNRDETLDYLTTYGLSSRKHAEKRFEFITHPLFRSYLFTYTSGYDLIEAASTDENRTELFLHLLTNPVLPSQLAAMADKKAA